ncbi:MAG: hypothetical protein ABWY82_08110, partial [Tardiphaga sp.]
TMMAPTASHQSRIISQSARPHRTTNQKSKSRKAVVSVHRRCCLDAGLAAKCSRQSSGKNTQIVAQ